MRIKEGQEGERSEGLYKHYEGLGAIGKARIGKRWKGETG